ncbi:MAG: hypothetical protein AAF411_15120 [Myxococcota bacterium]
MSDEAQDPIEDAWSALERSWDEDAAHGKFLALCETLGRLDEAGRRYRAVQDEGGKRGEDAVRRIDQLLARAMAKMEVLAVPPSKTPRRVVLTVGFTLAALLFGFALYLMSSGSP